MTECDTSTEELFLILYCIVDDLYQEAAPDWVQFRNGAARMDMTDPEIITLSIMQEGRSNDSELSFHRVVKKDYLHLFPDLICRSRYHRRRKDLMGIQREMLRLLMNPYEPTAPFGHVARPGFGTDQDRQVSPLEIGATVDLGR